MSRVSFDQIVKSLEALTGIDGGTICSNSRRPAVVQVRGLLCVLAHDHAGMSYPDIARACAEVAGDPSRSHSTFFESAQRMRARLCDELRNLDQEILAAGRVNTEQHLRLAGGDA